MQIDQERQPQDAPATKTEAAAFLFPLREKIQTECPIFVLPACPSAPASGPNRLAGRCFNWRNEDQLLLGNQPVEMFKVARGCVGDNTEFDLVFSPINPLIASKGS
jgi:hypothetical protein